MTSRDALGEARVIVGVDTRRDEHVAVAIDRLGARLGERRLPTTLRGYEGLDRWATGLGEAVAFGIEGTGSYGAGLARHLAGRGRTVIEVNRPDRSTRRRAGKNDEEYASWSAGAGARQFQAIGYWSSLRSAAGRDEGTALVRVAMTKPELTEGATAAAAFLKGFAHENRLLILCFLAEREMSVTELEQALGVRQPAVSQQLARLRAQNLVPTRRQAKSIYYSLASNEARQLIELLCEMFPVPWNNTTEAPAAHTKGS